MWVLKTDFKAANEVQRISWCIIMQSVVWEFG